MKENNIQEIYKTGKFLSHEKRITLLKKKYPKVDDILLEELKAIHTLTSQEVHENDWNDFSSSDLHFLIATTKEVLHEIYVTPDEVIKRREKLSELKKNAKSKK